MGDRAKIRCVDLQSYYRDLSNEGLAPDAENGDTSIDPVASAANLLNTGSKDNEDLEDDQAEVVKEGKAPHPQSQLSSPLTHLHEAVSRIDLGYSKRSTDFDFQNP